VQRDDDEPQLGFSFQSVPAIALPRRIWTVRELVGAARTALEREYTDIFVEGEISNHRPAESGHLYFTLKDGDGQLRVVMFRSQARLLRFKPANGMQVIARGRVTIYEARGELQLAAEYLEPKGAGALQVAFEQLKAKLAEEGLFDRERKKPLPAMPKNVGIVTSPRGAALQDMINILRRRHAGVNVLIYPAQVQGEYAAAEVAAGVKFFNRAKNVDVIVIARGGGSAEDLAAFNEEALARVIAASQIPTISAVGHETDFTIVDFVADLRAPTPSAAAELVIESRHHIELRVSNLRDRLLRATRYRLLMAKNRFGELAQHRAMARISDHIGRRQQRVDDLSFRLHRGMSAILQRQRRRVDVATTRVKSHDLRRVLAGMRREVESASSRLVGAARNVVGHDRARLDHALGRLNALSPLNILERGYAVVFDAAGNLVKDAALLNSGDEVRTRVARGEFKSRVDG
jgi:exodeoxyribonuclease VII large subunit